MKRRNLIREHTITPTTQPQTSVQQTKTGYNTTESRGRRERQLQPMLDKRLVSGSLFVVWILVLIPPSHPFNIRSPHGANSRFSNVKKLYYSSGLKDYLGSSEFNSTLPGDDVIMNAYDKWRTQYNKGESSPERFENFKVNYKTLMTANADPEQRSREGGSLDFASYVSLNEYGDCSIEEYKRILESAGQSTRQQNVNPTPSSTTYDQQGTKSYGEIGDPLEWDIESGESAIEKEIRDEETMYEIRQLYEAWCKEKGKPFDESRLPIFAEHYANAVQYCAQTNKPLKLNEYADLTTEEYNSLTFNTMQRKEESTASFKRQKEQKESTGSFNGQQQQNESRASFNGQQQQTQSTDSFNGQQQESASTAPFNEQRQQKESIASFNEQQPQKAPTTPFNGQHQHQEPTAPFNEQKHKKDSTAPFNGQQQTPADSKSPHQVPLNTGMSTGSYLDSISKGKVLGTYFGEKPEVTEEDLASLFSVLSKAKEVEEETKIQARRAEVAALEAGEVARIKEEEQARLSAAEEARQQALEESRLAAWNEAKLKAESEAKQRAQEASQGSTETQPSPSAVAFRPMSGSYLGAVAKTWESRSEYLAQLEASTKYLESLQDLPPSELPEVYDELDALTGSLPKLPIDTESEKPVPTLNTVEDIWEVSQSLCNPREHHFSSRGTEIAPTVQDENVEKKVEKKVTTPTREPTEIKDATTTEVTEIKDTTAPSTRRQRDEMAARRAREEAEEWMRIQKQLEEQADLARERREREENLLRRAEKRAKDLEAASLERERRLKEFQAMEGKKDDGEGIDRIKQLQENTERALREAAKLKEELENLSRSKSPSIMSFFASNKETKPNLGAFKQNQQFAAAQQKRTETLNRMTTQDKKKSFFDWLQNPPAHKSRTLASVTMWSQNEDGSITGIVERSSSFDRGVRITTSPILGNAYEGAVVVTASGNQYKLGEKDTSYVTGANAADLLMGFFDGFQKTQKTALLFDWKVNKDGTLTGTVSKKKGFNDGAKITTSPVIDEIGPGRVVRTLGGSYYRLL